MQKNKNGGLVWGLDSDSAGTAVTVYESAVTRVERCFLFHSIFFSVFGYLLFNLENLFAVSTKSKKKNHSKTSFQIEKKMFPFRLFFWTDNDNEKDVQRPGQLTEIRSQLQMTLQSSQSWSGQLDNRHLLMTNRERFPVKKKKTNRGNPNKQKMFNYSFDLIQQKIIRMPWLNWMKSTGTILFNELHQTTALT
jgi:hypothetical protein